ncbi:ThiF family adenylyltransferase [Paenibacillus puldeungensis]|uniref:ThiF family adenylyltransferase n=1 Tax=Paenibacillus puldeungensis TaxID=696536 RepID=A0ABW3RUD7_9BACL
MSERYSRQIRFAPIGPSGQLRLAESVVTVIGCGALGSAIAETLVRAGIGELHLVDRDFVEHSNLQRQQLFTEQDADEMLPKVSAAERRLRAIRSDVRLHTYLDDLDAPLAEQLAEKSMLLMDATDNFETRLLINDAAAKARIPWIYGACVGSAGVVFPFIPGESACFRCLLPSLPPVNQTCDTAGIISPAVQVTAALQCTEALKWLSGNRAAIRHKIHYFDLWQNTQMDIGISKIRNADCATCGEHPTYPSISASRSRSLAFSTLCGRDVVQVLPDPARPISLDDAENIGRRAANQMRRTPFFVELQVFNHRMILFQNGRLLIHGARSIPEARKLYHQLFG